MEFDWIDPPFAFSTITPREIEESFEDPFGLRMMPEIASYGGEARYFLMGKSLTGKYLFNVFWTDGKVYRVICSREMTEEEVDLYNRKNSEIYF